jgi:ankyrin repeat protein
LIFTDIIKGWRPINEVCEHSQTELMNVSLEYKPLLDVTVGLPHRKSPLHCAVSWRNLDATRALLSSGADPNIEGCWEGSTPLHLAAAAG